MKISFPKYGPGELLKRKSGTTRIIWFVAIVFFAGVCGSYLLGNKLWLLIIGVLGVAGILLCVGTGTVIFLNGSKVDRAASANSAPGAPIEENVPRLTPQWDYRPRKPIRGREVLDSPGTETSDGLTSDPFEINNNVWFNDNSPEDAASTFVSGPPETEETISEALPQTTDSVCRGPDVEGAAV
jgi:hypothetical protein